MVKEALVPHTGEAMSRGDVDVTSWIVSVVANHAGRSWQQDFGSAVTDRGGAHEARNARQVGHDPGGGREGLTREGLITSNLLPPFLLPFIFIRTRIDQRVILVKNPRLGVSDVEKSVLAADDDQLESALRVSLDRHHPASTVPALQPGNGH